MARHRSQRDRPSSNRRRSAPGSRGQRSDDESRDGARQSDGRSAEREARRQKRSQREMRPHGGNLKSARARGRNNASMPYDISDRILDRLQEADGPLSLAQLCELLQITDQQRRPFSTVLHELVKAQRVLQPRPGRFVAVGVGGEIPGSVRKNSEDVLEVVDADGEVHAVDPRSTLPIAAGDEVVFTRGRQGVLIVQVTARNRRRHIGQIEFTYGFPKFIPDERRAGPIPVRQDPQHLVDTYKAGDRVIAEITRDERDRPAAVLLQILDESVPEVADFSLVSLRHDLPEPFTEEVEAAAKAITVDWSTEDREDWRERLVFTIDPATAKDFDDAICLERTRDGWELAVHIADVAHFVERGGLIDQEAIARGTSCYLVNRVVPMLPEVLSNGLCSLVPGEERYALAAVMQLSKNGDLQSVRPVQTLIRSKYRLTYEEALAIIEREEKPDQFAAELVDAVRQAHRFAQTLRKKRMKGGALNLHSTESSFELDADGVPVAIHQASGDVAHELIEECMLLANRAIGHWLAERVPAQVWRVHSDPDEERLEAFAEMLEAYGLGSVATHDRKALQNVLQRLANEPPAARLVLNFAMLRSFQKAQYALENEGHYALSWPEYVHFTSPIRRYPDLIIHRLVKCALALPEPGYDPDELDALARQCSYLEQRAELAERDLKGIKSARYLSQRIGESFAAVVMTATPGGLFVRLLEVGLDAFVPVRSLGDEFFCYDGDRQALVGTSSGQVLRIGYECEVQIVAVDALKGQVDCVLAGASAPGASSES